MFKQNKISIAQYKAFKNSVTKQLRNSRNSYFKTLFTSVKNYIKKTWNLINGFLKPNHCRKNNSIKSLISNGIEYRENQDISDKLNNFFASIGRDISDSFQSTDELPQDFQSISNSIIFREVTPSHIESIISNLKNKACHISSYPARALKCIRHIISPILSQFVNKSMNFGIFPNSLKTARVIPLFKSGATTNLTNYRPISVLPLLSKVFERVVHNQLYSFLEKYKLLSSSQYGFRLGKSTSLAEINFVKTVYEKPDSGETVISFFLDFSKAFDCLDHSILISKLFQYGVRGIPLEWFKSYLSGRKQYVSVNSVNSTVLSLSHGVPQGSILGPLLFLIYINDFPSSNSFFKFNLFADDSTITCSFHDFNKQIVQNKLNEELGKVYQWLKINKIKINHEKSNFLIFSYRKKARFVTN